MCASIHIKALPFPGGDLMLGFPSFALLNSSLPLFPCGSTLILCLVRKQTSTQGRPVCPPCTAGHTAYASDYLVSPARLPGGKAELLLASGHQQGRASGLGTRACGHFFQLWDPIWGRPMQAPCMLLRSLSSHVCQSC